MDLAHYSAEAQESLAAAQKLARQEKHPSIDVEHLAYGLLAREQSGVAAALAALGVQVETARARLQLELAKRPKVFSGGPYLAPRLLQVAHAAEALRGRAGVAQVTSTLLCAALLDPAVDGGVAGRVLREAGATGTALLAKGNARAHVVAIPVAGDGDPLVTYGRDLTELARQGKLDPVVGRHDELRRVLQVLGRRTKNNPLLVGDPGVGKSAVVASLAQRLASGDVPASLSGCRLVAVELGALLAGAQLRGQFEERLRGLLQAVVHSAGEVILVLPAIDRLVGAGGGEGAMDASSLLQPAMLRGELRCLGTTTPEAYRRTLAKDAAFERLLAPIDVVAPSADETVSILRALKPRLEQHHGVGVTDEALVAAARLASRYIPGRSLPDKAIDLVDEAASLLRLQSESLPAPLEGAERQLHDSLLEQRALAGEGSTPSARRGEVEVAVATLQQRVEELRSRWQLELGLVQQRRAAQSACEQTQGDQTEAERRGDLDEAARLQFAVLPALRGDVERAEQALGALGEQRLLREAVSADDIATVVATATGIPVARMVEGERAKLAALEQRLHQRVIGQQEAVSAVAAAVRRGRTGLSDPRRPTGSFLFLGPTGVGKTELARALSEVLFDDEAALVRLDMSEFMERHAVARLTGAPPGYVGHDEGGQLTEAVRRKPYCVVLLDEVEKGHPAVFDLLLQILDDGRLTDSQGRTVSFKDAVIVMTSNLGSNALLEGVDGDGNLDPAAREACLAALHQHFRPELLNRIDDIVLFHPLQRAQLATIAEIQVRGLRTLLAAQGLTLELSDAARAFLVERGYQPELGARPLKRAITRHLQDPLALAIVEGRCATGSHIVADHRVGASVLQFTMTS